MPTTVTDRSLSGNDFAVFVSAQTAKGAIDANPVFKPVRRTEGKGMKTISYTTSGMVKSNRQGRKQVQDTVELAAEISSEATKDSIEFLIAAIHAEEAVSETTSSTVAANASGFTSTDAAFSGVAVGDYVFMAGFADASIDQPYLITAKADNDTITTTPVPPATEVAGASITVISNKSFSDKKQTYYALQTRATDLSKTGNTDYHTIYDGIINTQNLEVGETGIVTSSMSMMFENELAGTAAIAGQTDDQEGTDDPVSAVKGVKDFYVNGVSAKCAVKSMTIEVNNNYQSDDAAACSKRYGYGDLEVSGSISVRAPISAPFTWRDYNWDGQRVSIGVRLSHGNGDETIILMRQNVVTEHSMSDGSNVISASECSYVAEEDDTHNTTVEIFRNWT